MMNKRYLHFVLMVALSLVVATGCASAPKNKVSRIKPIVGAPIVEYRPIESPRPPLAPAKTSPIVSYQAQAQESAQKSPSSNGQADGAEPLGSPPLNTSDDKLLEVSQSPPKLKDQKSQETPQVISVSTREESEGSAPPAQAPSLDQQISMANEHLDTLGDSAITSEQAQARKKIFIPTKINQAVATWIRYFTGPDRERFERFLERGAAYKKFVDRMLAQEGLPTELFYLPIIESGYHTAARSKAQAVGVWQMIKGTGSRYGLMVNHFVDERQDPFRSTRAATRYLKDLHNVFQSWYLAMAAYNAGERRILGAIMEGNSRDFWTLVEKKALPRETMEYVPKFLAAVIIGENPERYGLDVKRTKKIPSLTPVEVPGGTKLSALARLASMDLEELETYNPHLLKGATPPGMRQYALWVPETKVRVFERLEGFLARYKADGVGIKQAAPSRAPAKVNHRPKVSQIRYERSSGLYYTVKRGDNLRHLSQKFNISMDTLRKMNGLKGYEIRVGQRLKVKIKG